MGDLDGIQFISLQLIIMATFFLLFKNFLSIYLYILGLYYHVLFFLTMFRKHDNLFHMIVAHWKHSPIKMNMNIWIRL